MTQRILGSRPPSRLLCVLDGGGPEGSHSHLSPLAPPSTWGVEGGRVPSYQGGARARGPCHGMFAGDLRAVRRAEGRQVKSPVWGPSSSASGLSLPRDHKLAGELTCLHIPAGVPLPPHPHPPPVPPPVPPPLRSFPVLGSPLFLPASRWRERGGRGPHCLFLSSREKRPSSPLRLRICRRPGTARKLWPVVQPSGNSCWSRTPTAGTSWLPLQALTRLQDCPGGPTWDRHPAGLAHRMGAAASPAAAPAPPHQGFP